MADKVLGKVVGGVAASIGLVSEGISARKKQSAAKKLAAQSNDTSEDSGVGEIKRDASRSIDSRMGADTRDTAKLVENPSHMPPAYEDSMEYDEEQWDLDDAQQDLNLPISGESAPSIAEDEPESSSTAKERPINKHDVHKLTDAFMAKYPVPEHIEEAGKMGLPVVLPQRRPKDRNRGFIRAYAPVLQTKGIDQETFLELIETFENASQAAPWIQAINLASLAAIPLGPAFSTLVSIAITMAVNVATEMHSRRRTNTFLNRANDEFFRPRGLFCLVMTWNPESDQHTDTINITSTISNRVALQTSSSRTQRITDQFLPSNGDTYGDIEFPEVAPLVFPALDQLADQTGDEAAGKREMLKKAKNFTAEYFDRRAVAKYVGKNPDSVLAAQGGPKPTFTSRYADPNHPASNGNLISLVTGGNINPEPHMRNMRQSREAALGGRRALGGGGRGFGRGGRGRGLENTGMGMFIGALVDRGSRGQSSSQPGRDGVIPPSQQRGGLNGHGRGRVDTADKPVAMPNPLGGIKRVLKQQVLYLMIVDMPTDEQLAAAAQEFK